MKLLYVQELLIGIHDGPMYNYYVYRINLFIVILYRLSWVGFWKLD